MRRSVVRGRNRLPEKLGGALHVGPFVGTLTNGVLLKLASKPLDLGVSDDALVSQQSDKRTADPQGRAPSVVLHRVSSSTLSGRKDGVDRCHGGAKRSAGVIVGVLASVRRFHSPAQAITATSSGLFVRKLAMNQLPKGRAESKLRAVLTCAALFFGFCVHPTGLDRAHDKSMAVIA